ncbi:glutamine amidotransferase [Mycobacterium sp. IS-1742]|uniref:gamma-glutamyl-gamma-aminobutyrate hydrolase family protein n=1 Tax=Mycobacterium sp. IS-1742 TaxID=1772285 RepID=UPI0007400470|nr:gamma-glutamyl-gamma-aminobutyrate hydrolase family protein [Mycobacterium sp. IS-1742]KUI27426.1 glutamine amidotransferase [Mycobacterium sp. IS-1742]
MNSETLPLIGVCGVSATARWGFWDQPAVLVAQTYLEAIHRAGGQPLILPPSAHADTDLLLQTVDALVLAGDDDIVAERDGFEIEIAGTALSEAVPVLGICRGLQALSVAAGGTLRREFGAQPPAEATFHTVDVTADSSLGEMGFAGIREVASHRRRGVATVGSGATVTAVSIPEGEIEAVEWPDHPFAVGVQWHPQDPLLHNLFSALISAATAPLFKGSSYPVLP